MDAKELKRGDIERMHNEAQNCTSAGVKWMTLTERPEAIAELAKLALAALPSDALQAADIREEAAKIAERHNYTSGGIDAARKIRAIAAPVAPAAAADEAIPGAETDLVLELAWLIDEGNCGPRSRAALQRAHAALKTVEAASADEGAPSRSRDAAQLTDWLLTDPQNGEPLRFAGPLEPDFLRFSRVRMESKSGAVWTLSARLEEGYLTAAERLANIKRAAQENGNE